MHSRVVLYALALAFAWFPVLFLTAFQPFVKFANIEEDTPSYHRSYDFFVSRFSEMCHSGHEDLEIKTKIRMSGIKGLQGVVRKTVNDELQANIWDPQHMDKIVPSLLFNLQHVEEAESRSPSPLQAPEKEKEIPAELAERCLRELLGRAAFGNIKNAIKPVLVEAARTLHSSFASTLPTYQRSEVILFIMSKVPLPSLHHPMEMGRTGENRNRLTQIMLLKSLLQVSTGFQCNNMMSALPSNFLDRLLSTALMEDAEIRLFVLEILISFIDRHGNRHKFSTISTLSDISVLKLKVDKCSRQDTIFMKKHSQQLYRHIYLSCKEEANVQQHYEALYGLLALISIELANEEVVVDLIRLVLAVQDMAQVNEENLPVYNRCALYALGAAYLNLISQLTTVPAFCQHIHEVIESRKKEAPYMLPEDVFVERPGLSQNLDGVVIEFLFRQSKISEVLGGSGYNADRLCLPYIPQLTDEDRLSKRKSIGETISLQVEVESRNSPEKEE
ncbi:Protein EFR3 B, partial [Eschrichtius robustus]|nr:Protein EFR3 B [Eschrichtius robustus]